MMQKSRTSSRGQQPRNTGCLSSSRGVPSTQNKRASVSKASTAAQPKYGSTQHRACVAARAAPAVAEPEKVQREAAEANGKPLRVIIAGAGIGGLVLAVGLLKRGIDVKVLERDVTAIRGEGKYRGPIQVQSNALAALEAIDAGVAKRVFEEGCITGDRINGLVDGVSGKWYVKFDTYHPAVERGLPVTRVISRVVLQQILAAACKEIAGDDLIDNGTNVVRYEERKDPVTGKKTVVAISEDGRRFEGDILIGADGIHSKVRGQLLGPSAPTYSEYTCYTGIADFTPPDIDTVGYRVFLGNGKYFVSSDVGGGKMQWYGFHKEPRGGSDPPGAKKNRLLSIFGHWTDMVTDLIKATPEADVLRRDIFDRPPILKWTAGRVVLLGDSAHAMQPNLGQGGCMAIEDGFQLAKDLGRDMDFCQAKGMAYEPEATLKKYQGKRVLRASTIHGLAGMAAIMASTYKAYLGEGLGPLSWIQRFKIPHPGRVGGYVAMNLTMPSVLSWVLGGNVKAFAASDRKPYCQLSEKPKSFCEADFGTFLKDDCALLRAAKARWLLVPAAVESEDQDSRDVDDAAAAKGHSESHERAYLRIALPKTAIHIDDGEVFVGSDSNNQVSIQSSWVSPKHAVVARSGEDYYVTDLGSEHGTYLNDRKIRVNKPAQVRPGDVIHFGKANSIELTYKVKMCHISVFESLAGLPTSSTAKIPQPA